MRLEKIIEIDKNISYWMILTDIKGFHLTVHERTLKKIKNIGFSANLNPSRIYSLKKVIDRVFNSRKAGYKHYKKLEEEFEKGYTIEEIRKNEEKKRKEREEKSERQRMKELQLKVLEDAQKEISIIKNKILNNGFIECDVDKMIQIIMFRRRNGENYQSIRKAVNDEFNSKLTYEDIRKLYRNTCTLRREEPIKYNNHKLENMGDKEKSIKITDSMLNNFLNTLEEIGGSKNGLTKQKES